MSDRFALKYFFGPLPLSLQLILVFLRNYLSFSVFKIHVPKCQHSTSLFQETFLDKYHLSDQPGLE